nr:hypothetical protein [Streptococcus gallolyticus]
MIVGRGTVHRVHENDPTTIVVNIALQPSAFSFNDLNFMLHLGGGQSISNILFTRGASSFQNISDYKLV